MISLMVYLNPKAGRERDLESAVRDKWLAAMSEQPGFVSAAVFTPYSDEALAKVDAVKPQSAYEVIALWRTEGERQAWVARPMHDEVFSQVLDASESVTYTLQTVEHSLNL